MVKKFGGSYVLRKKKRVLILQISQKDDFFLNGAGQPQISIKLIQTWHGV